jgi:zinc/manganese transport system substrate-binding protein
MDVAAAPSRRAPAGLLLALAMVLSACRGPLSPGGGEGPAAVAADGVLCDLVRVVAADALQVDCLIEPGTDPHTLSLSPAQARRLRQADLVLVHGLGLTPALADPPTGAKVVAVAEEAALEPVPLEGDSHGHDHGEGATAAHDHGDMDPHVWHDPRNTAAMAEVVGRRLADVAPAARTGLRQRARRAGGVLVDLDAWAARQIATIPADRRVLATAHRAFATYAQRYGLRELPLLDAFGGEGALRPAALAGFGAELKQAGVKTLFPEQSPPSKALQTIARQTGIPLADAPLSADGLAPNRSTVGTFADNTCTVVSGLGGRCDQQGAEKLERRWREIGAG